MTTDPRGHSGPGTAAPEATANTPMVRALKFAVVGMALLIVAGLGAVIWKIVGLANEPGKSAKVAAVQGEPAPAAALAPEALLSLPTGAAVRSTSLNGNRLAVHYDTPSGAEIAILDLETGKTLSRVRLSSAP